MSEVLMVENGTRLRKHQFGELRIGTMKPFFVLGERYGSLAQIPMNTAQVHISDVVERGVVIDDLDRLESRLYSGSETRHQTAASIEDDAVFGLRDWVNQAV